jgi:hypothetical protein
VDFARRFELIPDMFFEIEIPFAFLACWSADFEMSLERKISVFKGWGP